MNIFFLLPGKRHPLRTEVYEAKKGVLSRTKVRAELPLVLSYTPADEQFCFFFLHFLRFLCIYFMVFMQKSQRSLPRPSVMVRSQINFGCSPV